MSVVRTNRSPSLFLSSAIPISTLIPNLISNLVPTPNFILG
jgi:hypothetical protein